MQGLSMPPDVWSMIISETGAAASGPSASGPSASAVVFLDLLIVNKAITALSRAALARFLRVRCEVHEIHLALSAFPRVTALCVIGNRATPAPGAASLESARRAIAASGVRVLVSHKTDESKMAWMPEIAGDVSVTYACSYAAYPYKPFDQETATRLSKSRVESLVIDGPAVEPDLSQFKDLKTLVIRNGDFESISIGSFSSRTVERLELFACSFWMGISWLTGFPALKQLHILRCWCYGYVPVLQPFASLARGPVPPIETLSIVGGRGFDDVSPIAYLSKTLRTLIMHGSTSCPEFEEDAASGIISRMLVNGELNADSGCICLQVLNRLGLDLHELPHLALCACCEH